MGVTAAIGRIFGACREDGGSLIAADDQIQRLEAPYQPHAVRDPRPALLAHTSAKR